ncbi:fasciclin domain-containing protein [Thalassotalea sediminis]|uniref:fasciclin domain-containing protein n=1 Tax=Thalassotalea sediminis TaxID=1759089 RepID=UPI002573B337|nr:fasciclin domain-containing protein [Thalassotalea sediminis]
MTMFTCLFLLQACNDNDDKSIPPVITPPAPVTIVDAAVDNGNFTTLVAALEATGLDTTLADENASFTVFAPTDDAFALLGDDTINALLEDTDTLSDILTYHVISGEVDAAAAVASAGQTVEMVNGDMVGLSLDGDNLLVNTATVTMTDIQTDNGIIHVIDAVLMPPADKGQPMMNIVETAVADGRFTTLVAALQAAGLDGALADASGNFTVFAPTDDAFAMIDDEVLSMILADTDLLSNLLLQHVIDAEVSSVSAYALNGQQATTLSDAMIPVSINAETDMLMFGGANIVIKDIYTSNGIIHVIDAVVIGDLELPSTANTVVDVAVNDGNFTTLVSVLQSTGLDAVLSDPDTDFTVFAPTDDAFAKLDASLLEGLLANPEQLKSVLLYHVLSGAKVMSDAAITVANSENNTVTTANGSDVALTVKDATLYLNLSPVSAADVSADNGVIHVVDQVILPPAMKGGETMNIVELASSLSQFSTLVDAVTAAGLVDTLSDENANFTVFAPTNAAFDKIDDATLSALLADNTALTSVLLKHVLATEVNSVGAYAASGKTVETAGEDVLSINLVDFTKTSNDTMDEVAYDADSHMLVGGMNSSHPGFTLYVFDNDLGQSSSTCVDTCATAWPPVLVTDGMTDNIEGLSTIMREDGDMQAAYLGRPLYFYANDSVAGDMMGNGVNDVWWSVKQAPTSLQVQGANITSTDIYTTNGVIHVIDTVITSAENE